MSPPKAPGSPTVMPAGGRCPRKEMQKEKLREGQRESWVVSRASRCCWKVE